MKGLERPRFLAVRRRVVRLDLRGIAQSMLCAVAAGCNAVTRALAVDARGIAESDAPTLVFDLIPRIIFLRRFHAKRIHRNTDAQIHLFNDSRV